MARARNLKPGFFKDAKVVSCSFESRLLFQGLWCLADYMGRLKYVPLEIKMEIFPGDDVDVPACMDELEKNELIQIYRDSSGAALVQVLGFSKHQNPHVNERQDRNKNPLPCLPGPDECIPQDDDVGEEKGDIEQRVKDALVLLREYYQSDPADSLFPLTDSLFPISDSLASSPDGENASSEEGDDDPPESAQPKKPKKRRARIPDDFDLTEDRRQRALAYWLDPKRNRADLDPDDEFDKFKSHHQAKGTPMLSWDAAWQTWYSKAVTFNAPPRGGNHAVSQSALSRRAELASHYTDFDKATDF